MSEETQEKSSRPLTRKDHFETLSGIPIADYYGPAEGERPGEYPFTRGIRQTMYRGRLWTMRQYAGMGDAVESNARYRFLLEQGQTGLSIAFDLPTQIGLDSDDPLAEGEVGKVGVAIDSLSDMEILLEGIPLDRVTSSMTINATAVILLALYIAVAEKNGVPRSALGGTIQNDILKEYIARGTYIFPPKPSLRIVTDIFEFCSREMPRWNTISISGYHIREAGSTAIQEIAFTLADGIAYVEAMLEQIRRKNLSLTVDDFAPRLSFFFNCQMDFFEEIAKFRAARRLWARIMKERFGARNPKSMQLRFHTQTAGSSLNAQQIDCNVVRTTIEALAAVCGGTQSLHTNARDEALALPTEASARLALRTQQVIAYETGVADVVDPLGGSYYVEELTRRIEEEASRLIEKIDAMGGMLEAIEAAYPQQAIREAAYRYQRAVESGERVVVGVNRFTIEEPPPELFRFDPAIEKRQRERLREFRAGRSGAEVEKSLASLESAARSEENIVPPVLAAVRAGATVGEIVARLKNVFGTYAG
ncbi:MAG: methylmalonyl-CoA mutase [Candidatus Hydrogenedentota bacterium]|nr:MAG: methylmalonyl-CoA mutase [Candidatus Hydrogenedentota bacterium]